MTRRLSPVGSFVAGMPRHAQFGYVVYTLDELSEEQTRHSVLMAWVDGRWGKADQAAWHCCGIGAVTVPREHTVAVGEYGYCVAYGPGGYLVRERIGDDSSGPRRRGPLRGVRSVDDRIYVVGMDRQAWMRVAENDWEAIELGLPGGEPGADPPGLEAIDGYGAQEIYAVGWNGEIWRFDGRNWTRESSPTNMILTDVCCAGDEYVYGCGRRGLLIRGRQDTWSVIEQDQITADIWGLAWFDGRLFIATFDALYVLDGGAVQPVDMGADAAETFYRLAVGGDRLWSIGAKDILAFDGAVWTRID